MTACRPSVLPAQRANIAGLIVLHVFNAFGRIQPLQRAGVADLRASSGRAAVGPDPWRTDEIILTPSTLLPLPRDGITPLD
ncbi:MAG: hypothetical protein IID06_05875 [Gemmatimonadetes bacterium]|nr:hypothetical protein [Gemmatimonadota bacterium]